MLNIDHPVGDGDETPSSGIYFTRFITFKGLRIGPIVMYIVLIIIRRKKKETMCCCISSGCPCSSWLDREFYIYDDGFIQYKRDRKRK
jgi:hypothetical protein